MVKIVLKVDISAEGAKARAFSMVAKIPGVKSIAADMEKGTLTVVGEVDVVCVVNALRKAKFNAHVITVGDDKMEERSKIPPARNKGEPLKIPPAKEEESKKFQTDPSDGYQETSSMDLLLLPWNSVSLGAMVSIFRKLAGTGHKTEIKKLTTRLLKLSRTQDPPVTARIWMKDVRELSYDMDNCVAAEEDWIGKLSGFMDRMREANGRYDRYKLESVPSRRMDIVSIPAVVRGQKPADPVVGLHAKGGAVETLCNLLTDGDEQLKVLSIVGVAGIGKTTLGKQLWRERKLRDYFDCRAFVRMAKKPDMRIILRSILAQVRPHQPPDAGDVHDLIHDLTEHLQNKRYFLIIDDLWATSVWDVATCAFPEGNHGSRIITTTEIEDIALASCSYQSKYIFKMEPLSVSHSKELFTSAVFGSGKEKSHELDLVSDEIIRRCDGLPQAIISISSVLASHGEANTVENWEQIQNSLPTNTTSDEILKQVLYFCYDSLPISVQACLLYLGIYPENYIILIEDIAKQWVAEGFIGARTEKLKMMVAHSYFNKLVKMGMIQQIDVNYSDEVLYYAVHHMVHDFITSKCKEENFISVIDYSQRTVRFSNKVSRMSLQFGSATYATTPPSIGLSQVRSLAYTGLSSCLPPNYISEFKLLRVLILHIWADQPSTGVDLECISALLLLRYLQATCNCTVHLPEQMQRLKHLETLEINARVAAIPSDIVHFQSLLYLRLGGGTQLPDVTGILKNVTLNPAISMDESSSPPDTVMTIEILLPIFRTPKRIGQLTKLHSLKIVVRELLRSDISNLQGLPSLTVLSLHVLRQTTELIGFASGAFRALVHFEFRCGVLRLIFQEGTMPNLQRLTLGFNAHRGEQYGASLLGIEDMLSVQKIYGIIGSAIGAEERDLKAAESAFKKAMGKHPNVTVKRIDMVDEEYGPSEKEQTETIQEKDAPSHVSSEQPAIPKQESEEDAKQNDPYSIQRRTNRKDVANVAQGYSDNLEIGSGARGEVNLMEERQNSLGRGNNSMVFTLNLIETITNDFSDDQKVGSGGHGDVYKAMYKGLEIAVKKLRPLQGLDDKQFQSELYDLTKVCHQNIVRLIGYCYESRHKYIKHNGETIWAKSMERVLCFEYIQGESLEKHIADGSCELGWPMCYNIIRGTCEGLNHLHSAPDKPILHLNLKPANILLDKSMMPKIADLGLSRVFASSEKHQTEIVNGTNEYMPPEYLDDHFISKKFDVFSFGVIILKMVAGNTGYFHCCDMSPKEFIKIVSQKWTKRLQAMPDSYSSHEVDIIRVTKCVEIALRCVDNDRDKRPRIKDIVHELEELEVEMQKMSIHELQNLTLQENLETQTREVEEKRVREELMMAENCFGEVVDNYKLNKMTRYLGKPKTQEDRAREALNLVNEDDKEGKASSYVDDLKRIHGGLVSTSCLVYNATGDTLYQVDYHDWHGHIGSPPCPARIGNGQWAAFHHVKAAGETSGSAAAVVYRSNNRDGQDREYLVAWSTPWGPFSSTNKAYCEIGGVDSFKNSWDSIYHKMSNSDFSAKATSDGCDIEVKIGGGASAPFISRITMR